MCTLEKRGNLFILILTNDEEHRLDPTLITTILSTLSQVKAQVTQAFVLITISHGKFFSNGFDRLGSSCKIQGRGRRMPTPHGRILQTDHRPVPLPHDAHHRRHDRSRCCRRPDARLQPRLRLYEARQRRALHE
ncbi:hypothetical protein SLE2022_143450 [Rubroshorea leprosula]